MYEAMVKGKVLFTSHEINMPKDEINYHNDVVT